MPKTLVICSDGTGNSNTGKVPSNVKRLFDLIIQDGPHQVATKTLRVIHLRPEKDLELC
jgi:uncharacterized protein (DUF2235 family)